MYERIDGTDYVIGSPEHAMAKRVLQHRFDEAYLKANEHLVERNLRLLHGMESLQCRADANATAFLARQLVFTRGVVEKVIYDRLRAAELIPVNTEVPRGVKSYATQLVDMRGEAVVSHQLAKDSPGAEVGVSEDMKKLANVQAHYSYSKQDLEYAAYAGTPLERWKAEACGEMIARKLDKIGRSGDSGVGLTGLFNNPLVTLHTLTNGEWLTATAAELRADLFEIEQTIISAVRDNALPGYRLLLPTAYEGRIATLVNDSTSNMTVKQFFLANSRLITSIERWVALDDATSPDVAASDAPQGICYRPDPSTIIWPIPIMYEELPPEVRGWTWTVEARAYCGGVEFRRPKEALYIQNLD